MAIDHDHRQRWRKANAERQALLGILNRAHGALTDCGDIPVPGAYDEEIAPAIETLLRQRDEARAACRWTLTSEKEPPLDTLVLCVSRIEADFWAAKLVEVDADVFEDEEPFRERVWINDEGDEFPAPLAWMPLPDLPEALRG